MPMEVRMRRRVISGAGALLLLACATPALSLEGRPASGMLIIGHRGAPVYTTESSEDAYRRAAALGADLLEGDLVMSKDGQLVICHDLDLSRVTDVATKFPGRATVRNFNGVDYGGYWVDDYTWDELSQLRKPNGQSLLRLDDLLNLNLGRTLYMEVKESAYFQAHGLDVTQKLIDTLNARGLAGYGAPFWVQSDNSADLLRIKQTTGNRTVFLTRTVAPEDVGQFPAFRQFADVLSVPTTRARRGLVAQAHAADLGVHVWTLRGSRDAYRKAAAIGADGVVTDFPDLGVDVRSKLKQAPAPTGVATKVENGNAVATWSAGAGVWYAVTFNFGDPLLAPTVWVQGGSASYPMAEAKDVDITVASWNGVRMSQDAFSHAAVKLPTYDEPRVKTRVASVNAVVATDGRTRLTGSMEKLKGKNWVPLRNGAGWVHGRGEDVGDLRRTFHTDKKGNFRVTVRVREDIISGYVPQRSWMVGVTPTKQLKGSSSDWVKSEEGAAPTGKSRKAQSLPGTDVRVR